MFGSSIADQQRKAAVEINHLLNSKWERLPSGMNNITPLFRYLRKCLWHSIALRKASDNAKNRLQANARNPVQLTQEFTKDDFKESLYQAAMRACELEWSYPLSWITFLFMGQPALRVLGHMSPMFSSGLPVQRLSQGLGPLEAAQGIGGKAARRACHETVQGKRAAPSKDYGGRRKGGRYETPTSSESASSSSEWTKTQVMCSTMMQEIKLMEEVGMPRDEIDSLTRQTIIYLKNFREATKRSLDIVDLVNEECEVNFEESV